MAMHCSLPQQSIDSWMLQAWSSLVKDWHLPKYEELCIFFTFHQRNSLSIGPIWAFISSPKRATLPLKIAKIAQNKHLVPFKNWYLCSRSPVIIQISNGGAAFLAGKGIKNDKQKAAVLGSIAGAHHVRLMAKHYGIPVVLHSDHCAKKLLDWFDGMLEADEEYFKVKILNSGPSQPFCLFLSFQYSWLRIKFAEDWIQTADLCWIEWTKLKILCWHLIAPPSTPDFSGLNLAFDLVTSCCGCHTACWRPVCCWLGRGFMTLVTPVKAIRVGEWGFI